jgi:hypothetical protein
LEEVEADQRAGAMAEGLMHRVQVLTLRRAGNRWRAYLNGELIHHSPLMQTRMGRAVSLPCTAQASEALQPTGVSAAAVRMHAGRLR